MYSRLTARGLSRALGGWRTREPAYEALADGIRLLCLDNRIAPRTALPAERELAAELAVSRTTVAAAYRSLRESAHIESLRGSGSVTLPQRPRTVRIEAVGSNAIDLQQASPAAWPGLAGILVDVAQDAAALTASAGYDTIGSPALRDAIADRYTREGLPTRREHIMVTSGAQSAIHLLAHTLLRRGDAAVIESPTYPHAAESLRSAGARLVGIPVDVAEGWDLERARQAFARTTPRLAYLMPRFQNPTGRTMTADEAAAVAAAASRAGTTLLVDETTADLAIDPGAARPSFDGAEVVRIGSLGKSVWGGLRVGWFRADPDLIRRVHAMRPRIELGTAEFEQAVAARIVPRLSEVLAQRAHLLAAGRDALQQALAARLPQWRCLAVMGGVSLWVELDAPLSTPLVLAARSRGLFLSAGSRFAVDSTLDRHLRLPYTAPVDDLVRAVDILADAWPEVLGAAPAPTAPLWDAVV